MDKLNQKISKLSNIKIITIIVISILIPLIFIGFFFLIKKPVKSKLTEANKKESQVQIFSPMPTTIMPTTIMPTTIQPTTIMPTTIKPTTQTTTIMPTTIMPTIQPTTIMPTTIRFKYVKNLGITFAQGGLENVLSLTPYSSWYAIYSLKENGISKPNMKLTIYIDGTLLPPRDQDNALIDIWVGTGDPSIHYINNKVFVISDNFSGSDLYSVGGVSTTSNSTIVYTVENGIATLNVNGVGRTVNSTISSSFANTSVAFHKSVLSATFEW